MFDIDLEELNKKAEAEFPGPETNLFKSVKFTSEISPEFGDFTIHQATVRFIDPVRLKSVLPPADCISRDDLRRCLEEATLVVSYAYADHEPDLSRVPHIRSTMLHQIGLKIAERLGSESELE